MWTALEGETFVIFAGLFAQRGMLNIWLLLLSAWSGTFIGDQIFFLTGRRFGIRILDHLPRLKQPIDRALGWLERHAEVFILAYRFMYGLRNISGIAIGMSHVPWRTFMLWNAIAAWIWAVSFAGFGYMYGDVIARMHHKTEVVNENVRGLMLGMLGLFLFIVVFRLGILWWQKSKKPLCFKGLILTVVLIVLAFSGGYFVYQRNQREGEVNRLYELSNGLNKGLTREQIERMLNNIQHP
ncbi:MAG: DedA family protein [Alphaproteobacteria bacterium]|nr:DedA family protein [Alphaproteobacteria bacterium]